MAEQKLKELGWANGWKKDDPAHAILARCRELGHVPSDHDIGPPMRGIDHHVVCRECGYSYHYDCSD